eukprot:scaffold69176_cov60-Phaeocystis_antarctica.AAC.1
MPLNEPSFREVVFMRGMPLGRHPLLLLIPLVSSCTCPGTNGRSPCNCPFDSNCQRTSCAAGGGSIPSGCQMLGGSCGSGLPTLPPASAICSNTCTATTPTGITFAPVNDGVCDDGGPGSDPGAWAGCPINTDVRTASQTLVLHCPILLTYPVFDPSREQCADCGFRAPPPPAPPSEWVLILRQTVPSTFALAAKTTFLENENNPQADTFTNMGLIQWADARYRVNGKLRFLAVWTRKTNGKTFEVEWEQANDPMTDQPTGYEKIRVQGEDPSKRGPDDSGKNAQQKLAGIAKSNTDKCMADGNGDGPGWWNCFGAIGPLTDGGIPSHNKILAKAV